MKAITIAALGIAGASLVCTTVLLFTLAAPNDVGAAEPRSIQQARPYGSDVSQRASVAIVDSIFGAAMAAWARGEPAGNVRTACAYLQLLDIPTIKMLAEPHRTAALTASAHCMSWSIGDLTEAANEELDESETRIFVPVTLWICEHGSDDLKAAVRICSDPGQIAMLDATWRALKEDAARRNAGDAE